MNPELTNKRSPACAMAGLALVIFACTTAKIAAQTVELREGTVFRFADVDQGRRMLRTEDDFVKCMSAFDRSALTQKEGEVSTAEYLEFIGTQVRTWTDEELQQLTEMLTQVRPKVEWLRSPLPPEILIVKTSATDEGGNPYTRGSAIMLPEGFVQRPHSPLEHVILHELFHVLSRHNPALRPRLYAVVGFELCNELSLPQNWDRRRLTNPDAPMLNVFIQIEENNRKVAAAPILVTNHEYRQSSKRTYPQDYFDFRLMEIVKKADHWSVRLVDNEPVFLNLMDVSGFHEKIGQNTAYIIHPEEILADNFAIAALNKGEEINSPTIVEELKKVLAENP